MTVVVVAAFAGIVGVLVGMILAARHIEWECEKSYLTGHVDGYGKAMSDCGEVGR